jgi:hypothetical protein
MGRHLHDWHSSRSVVGMQLTFAPAVAAVLAVVAKPDAKGVLIVKCAVIVLAPALGLMQLPALRGRHASGSGDRRDVSRSGRRVGWLGDRLRLGP